MRPGRFILVNVGIVGDYKASPLNVDVLLTHSFRLPSIEHFVPGLTMILGRRLSAAIVARWWHSHELCV